MNDGDDRDIVAKQIRRQLWSLEQQALLSRRKREGRRKEKREKDVGGGAVYPERDKEKEKRDQGGGYRNIETSVIFTEKEKAQEWRRHRRRQRDSWVWRRVGRRARSYGARMRSRGYLIGADGILYHPSSSSHSSTRPDSSSSSSSSSSCLHAHHQRCTTTKCSLSTARRARWRRRWFNDLFLNSIPS